MRRHLWIVGFVTAVTILVIPIIGSEPFGGPRPMNTESQNHFSAQPVAAGVPSEENKGTVNAGSREPLSASQTEALIKRIPPFDKPMDSRSFNLLKATNPAPRPGETVEQTFPPRVAPEGGPDQPAEKTSLEVLRISPSDEVTETLGAMIVFSKAMIPLTRADVGGDLDVPVTIRPQPEHGQWRWLDPQTLVFETKEGMPGATQYEIHIPSGIQAMDGSALGKSVVHTFKTPAPSIVSFSPSQRTGLQLNPIMAVRFNQAVSAEAVLPFIRILADDAVYAAEIVPESEWADAPEIRYQTNSERKDHVLVFRASRPFPKNTSVSVTFSSGLPSAEGPIRLSQDKQFQFKTYEPLEVQQAGCGTDGCAPNSQAPIHFNNQLDPEHFDPAWVEISPEVEDFEVSLSYRNIYINGKFQADSTYKVRLAANIQDTFGQTLEKAQTVSIRFNEGYPEYMPPGSNFFVLNPYEDHKVQALVRNFREFRYRIYRVRPEDFNPEMLENRQDWSAEFPGEMVAEENISIKDKSVLNLVNINLSALLQEGYGQFLLVCEPKDPVKNRFFQRFEKIQTKHWIQVTDMAVDALWDKDKLYAWVTNLKTGEPVSGARVWARSLGKDQGGYGSEETNKQGLATFSLQNKDLGNLGLWVVQGDDRCLLPEKTYRYQSSEWRKRVDHSRFAWHAFTDRGLYKPGETVSFKGWVRELKPGASPSLPNTERFRFEAFSQTREKIASGEGTLDAFGGFHQSFTLTENATLGSSSIIIHLLNDAGEDIGQSSHFFKVEEFRRPEFEVGVETDTPIAFAGDSFQTTLTASYYSGGTLPNAMVEWRVSSNTTGFTPPNRGDYAFGQAFPWWFSRGFGDSQNQQYYQGSTDAAGRAALDVTLDVIEPALPRRMRIWAGVTEVNQQQIGGEKAILIHPSELYVGIKSNRYFVREGEPFDFDLIACDLDGNLISGKAIALEAVLVGYKWAKNGFEETRTKVFSKTLNSDEKPVTATFTPTEGGSYEIRATIQDDSGRKNQTIITRWVSGGSLRPNDRNSEQQITLVPDKDSYESGDTAEILVLSPFENGHGLLMVEHASGTELKRFELKNGSASLTVKIGHRDIPNLPISVQTVGYDQEPEKAKVPVFAHGSLDLKVPANQFRYEVKVTPEHGTLRPGEEALVHLRVHAEQGSESTQVALMVVDESLLDLGNIEYGDPLESFYPHRHAYLRRKTFRSNLAREAVEPAIAEEMVEYERSPAAPMRAKSEMRLQSAVANEVMADEADAVGGADGEISVRQNFDALAAYFPDIELDGSGSAQVRFTLPDSLTRYRIIAVAAGRSKLYGKGEAALTAALPLMVRPSAPRFLNYGDQFELPVVIQNQTDETREVHIAATAQNAQLTGDRGFSVVVPAGDRVEVLFPAETIESGTARFRFAITSDDFSDAAEVSIPVWTPVTTEAFAVYGSLTEGTIAQPVQYPSDIIPEFGGLNLEYSSTALHTLKDALLYLHDYPFFCAEQRASRVLGITALKDVLPLWKDDLNPDAVRTALETDIKELTKSQRYDGGWSYWPGAAESDPYISVHIAHALIRADVAGYTVANQTKNQAIRYLDRIDRAMKNHYSPRAAYAIRAYAAYTMALAGQGSKSKAALVFRLLPENEAPLSGLAWLAIAYPDTYGEVALKRFENAAGVTASKANFAESFGESNYLTLQSNRKTDALVLEALLTIAPDHDLVVKTVRGLEAGKTRGRWYNTQENAFALLAISRYFHAYESVEPDAELRTWLGEFFVGESQFQGRDNLRRATHIPMYWLAEHQGEENLILEHRGQGRLYYRLGMNWAPQDLEITAESRGFHVERSYQATENEDDVVQLENGEWVFKRGSEIKVTVTMTAPSNRYHVALVDPLPAGCEPLNPALGAAKPNDPQPVFKGWWGPWYNFQNLRDNRAEAFATRVYGGVYRYEYIMRATTPGSFVVPPAKAEEMYEPETYGRSGSTKITIQ